MRGRKVHLVRFAILVGLAGSLAAPAVRGAADGTCEPAGPCLSGRFSVTADWWDPRSGDAGSGLRLPVTADTAAFWFFDPENLELVVKALDGRTVNGRYWVFASGLTDLAVTLEVRDSVTGLSRVYRNPPFTPALVLDTSAFEPRLLDPDLTGRRVMWIGAHPDDEVLAAPWLGDLCVVRGASCVFLVVTRGEAGGCALDGGCQPDLASVRVQEMKAAAALFGSILIQWRLPDGSSPDPAEVRRVWAASAGGEHMLLERLATAIAAAAPDWVFSFDSRHGTTGHADHRALGGLVEEALERLSDAGSGSPPALWRLASRALFEDGLPVGFEPAGSEVGDVPPPRLLEIDAGKTREDSDLWPFVIEDARRHPSQFASPALEALERVPRERRRVFVLDSAPP